MTDTSTWVASKFCAETDPSRPQIGTAIEHNGKQFKIGKVEAVEVRRIVGGEEFTVEPYDELLIQDHPTRPFVKWFCWAKQQE